MSTATLARAQPVRPGRQRPNLAKVSTRAASTGLGVDEPTSHPLKPTPHVITEEYILSKYPHAQASLSIHCYDNHWRFEQQDGNFSYKSEMATVLKHVRARTVPHEILDELYSAHIPWYDGNLIVDVHDHRDKGQTSNKNTTNQVGATDHKPYSIHNYNEHITPSPLVPFPDKAKIAALAAEREKANDKENAEQMANQKNGIGHPTVMRRVLFWTPLCHAYDMERLATTPCDVYNHGSRPGTPSLAHPPTPLTSVPPTPQIGQRMLLDSSNAKEFEAEIINMTAPPLILTPAGDLESSLEIIDRLADPRHSGPTPVPQGRKRTVAEMAADDAQAAALERYMLSSDDRRQSLVTTSTSGSSNEAARAPASGEAQFKRFRLLESLKMKEADLKRQQAEQEAQQAAAKRQMHEEKQRKLREEQLLEQQRERNQQQQQEYVRRQQMAAAQRAQQQAAAQTQQQMQTPAPNNPQQMPMSASQQTPQLAHMSPVVRHQTPMSASPVMGGMGTPITSAPMNSIPMATSASNQGMGAGSPPRPSSTVPTSAGGVGMMRNLSQQQGSAHGTPQMHNTPSIPNAAPVNRHMTPQPRPNQQGSPMPNPMQTPQLMMQTPIPNMQNLTPEQRTFMLRRQQSLLQAQAQAQAQQGSGMSPQQIQQMLQMQQMAMGGANNAQPGQPMGINQASMTPQQRLLLQQHQSNAIQASMNQAQHTVQQLISGSPPQVQQRLSQIYSQHMQQYKQEDAQRKQTFMQGFPGGQVPEAAQTQWQLASRRHLLESMNRAKQAIMNSKAQMLQQMAGAQANGINSMQMQQGMSNMSNVGNMNMAAHGNQPGTPGQANPASAAQNHQYMQQLLRQKQMMQAHNAGGAGMNVQNQQGGQQQMMQGQAMNMTPQMLAQLQARMQAQGQNLQGLTPHQMMAHQQAHQQRMLAQQMTAQQNGNAGGMNLGANMGNFNMNGSFGGMNNGMNNGMGGM